MGFLNVLSFLGICLWMCYRFERRIEETLPPVICLWMVVLYGLAIFKQLSWVDPLLLAVVGCSAAWLVFRLATRKSTWGSLWSFLKTYVLTPGFIAMILLAGVFWVLTSARYVIDGDELNYWAVEVKSLWYHNGLVDASHHSALQFSSYTPGMQLIEWWYMHVVGVWRENVLYFALFYTNALFLLPFMRKTTFRQWPSIPLFVLAGVLAPTVFSGAVYTMLSTDASVGILFGYALFMLWQAENEERFIPLAVGSSLSALVIAKQAGFIWAVFALLFFVFVTRKRRTIVRRYAWAFALAAPLVVWLSWYVFCRVNHLGNQLTGSGFSAVQAILSGSYVRPSGTGNILKYILYAFVASPPNMSGYWDGKTSWLGLPLLGWLIVFGAIPLLCRRAIQGEEPLSRKSMAARVAVIMVTVGLGYTLMYAISFFTVFSNEVLRYANNQWGVTALMDRYFIPYYFGAGYLSFAILTEQLALWKRQGKKIMDARSRLFCYAYCWCSATGKAFGICGPPII